MSETTDRAAITTANLAAWDEAAPIHRAQNHARLVEAFRLPGHSVLDEVETALLTRLGVAGKDVAQVCCNNGREILSVKNMGARRVVGFDGSRAFIEQARELGEAGGIEAEFVCTDIYDIDPAHAGAFDLVTITIGVISWMPDLPRFFEVVAGLIRPGGALFIYEQHPVVEMFRTGAADTPVEFELSYFSKEPYVETGGLDYYGGDSYESKPLTSFLHTMSDIIMAGIGAGLAVEDFREYPTHISNAWWNVEAADLGVPMSYTLVLRKG
ncbi:class I SAM-dependent methyltransferase [Rhodobacteraceae bacterium NNCM2]|nr:class I SAM-dependent methyltransferase [Coraliihabitans acroporae]